MLLFTCTCSASDELVLVAGNTIRPGWEATAPVGGASFEVHPDAIRFTLDAWQEGMDGWPRIRFSGDTFDLSACSELVLDVESLSDQSQTLVVTVGADNENLAAAVAQFEPRQRQTISVNLAEGCGFDPSQTAFIHLYRQTPPVANTYRLLGIRAVINPDFISTRVAAGKRIDLVRTALDSLAGADSETVTSLASLLNRGAQQFSEPRPGYLAALGSLLDRIENRISREHMARLGGGTFVWSSPLGMPIRPDTLPAHDTPVLSRVDLALCRNQYLAFCVNITSTDQPRDVSVRIARSTVPGLLHLREAEFVKARDGGVTADALGTPSDSMHFSVPNFETRQLLLWADSKSGDIPAGEHSADLEISIDGEMTTLPVGIRVLDHTLPSVLPLKTFAWAVFFHTRSVTPDLNNEALANLRDYGINTWYVEDISVPLPELDAEGRYAGLIREEAFRQILGLLAGRRHENFILWLGLERGDDVRRRFVDPEVVAAYLADVNRIMAEFGIPPERRFFTPMDEPKMEETLANMRVMALFRKVDPSVRFFDNGSDIAHDEETRTKFFSLVDVWCPNWDHFLRDRLGDAASWQVEHRTNIGFYRCLMSRNNRTVNIHEYYRLAAWRAMRHGFGNLGFWSYNAGHGEDVWDGTTGSASGGVVIYVREGKLLSSRRWELYREGLTDYQIASAVLGTADIADLRKSPALLTMANRVLASENDPETADRARAELLEMLEQKSQATAGEEKGE